MNREILFRGKRIDNGEWVEGSLINCEDFYCCIFPSLTDLIEWPYYLDGNDGTIDGRAVPIDPSTVGQYTGLKDKNGKRIFEGDVVSINHIGIIGAVVYDQSSAAFEIDDGNEGEWLWYTSEVMEVVGNIYDHDNPEPVGGAK